MNRHLVITLLMAGALATSVVGCADYQLPELPTAPAPVTSVTIGPEGGRVALPLHNGLGQASIKFPPGALTEPTTITIAPGLHNAALPDRAFPVGPYVRLEPKGLTLAKPALVTLPVYPELRGAFGQDAKFVKVWLKGPEKWELYEQVNAGDGFVTIETQRLDVAGAGVKMPPALTTDPNCLASGACTAANVGVTTNVDTTCSDAYCIATLEAPTRVPLIPRLVAGAGYVSWLDLADGPDVANVEVCAHKVTVNGAIQYDAWQPLAVALDRVWDTLRARGAVDEAGQLTVAQLGGLARFDAGAEFVPGADPTLTLAALSDGRMVHLMDDNGRISVALRDKGGAWAPPRHITGLPLNGAVFAAEAEPGVMVVASGAMLVFADVSATTLTLRPDTLVLPAPMVGLAATPAGLAAILTSDGAVSIVDSGAGPGAVQATQVLTEAHALASDGVDFWVAFNNRPALAHVAADGSVAMISLAAGDTVEGDDIEGLVPRALGATGTGAVVVLTRGAEFLHVRRGTLE